MPDDGHDVRLDAFVTPSLADADAVVALAEHADRLRLDLVGFSTTRTSGGSWRARRCSATRTSRATLAPFTAVEAVDAALMAHLLHPEDLDVLQQAVDTLTDSRLSHLADEEEELVEPLARHGFGPAVPS